VRIQAVWDDLAGEREWVTAINILGVTQAAGGYNATVGNPDMENMGPAK
jgi:hypothetical protein